MDRALIALWDESGGAAGVSLTALGGYGRGELSPRSDVDLVFLYRGRKRPEALTKRVLYALWDAGFEVGHATRTIKDSLKLAGDNHEAHTSYLSARPVAGDAALHDEFVEAVRTSTRKRWDAFGRAVAEATVARHRAAGTVPFRLEPNVKDGAGGLRDLHVVRWLEPGCDECVAGSIASHAEIIHRIRNWLHDATERRTDVFSLAHQDAAAAGLGYEGDRPGDALMRDYYTAARAIWWHSQTCLAAAAPAFTVSWPRPDAAPFAAGAWTPDARRAFVEVLRSGSARALEELDQAAVPARMFPEWDRISSLPQRNIYHRYTVDVHCFETVAQAVALGGDDERDRMAADVWRDLADPDRMLLAALFHDAGKGADEDHSQRGERLAREWTRAMGFGDDAADEVAWLVRHHLLLAETATRRDIADQRLVESLAAQIGAVERCKMLYVLTVADARATGPEAWTPWKAALVAELFGRVMHVLERGEVVGADVDQIIKRRTAEVRDGVAGREPGEVDAHLLGMTRAYVLAFPSPDLIRHFALMHPPPEPEGVRMHAAAAGEPGLWEVTTVARDRPGLFAILSGALAVSGLNIVGAQGFTRLDGIAVEVFSVVGALDKTFDESRWAKIEQAFRDALSGSIDLDAELAERRRAYARESKGKREPTRVEIDNDASDFATVIEVHATDRVGLLYDITKALADFDLDIRVARIATYGHDVVDVFYVLDLLGQRLEEPDRIAAVRDGLLARIGRGPRRRG